MAFRAQAAERFLKIVADQNRLRIIKAIGANEASVSEILKRTELPQTLASFHLRVLREAGLVTHERRGAFLYYRLSDVSLLNFLEACAKYAELLRQPEADAEFAWPLWKTMCCMPRGRRR